MSEKVVLMFALSAEDFRNVQQFRYSKESKSSFSILSPAYWFPFAIIGLLVFVASIARGSAILNSAVFALGATLASGITGALISTVIGQPLQFLARSLGERAMYQRPKEHLAEHVTKPNMNSTRLG